MNLLLDTHTFLWWAAEPAKLSPNADSALHDTANTLYLSVASIWEMQIKLQLGKLTLSKPLPDLIQNQQHANGLRLLAIEPAYIYSLADLPQHHKDPFDRLIIAQALAESMTVVGADGKFSAYPVSLLW
jgi:PIN domain nuclease of toxin-antitoxin system